MFDADLEIEKAKQHIKNLKKIKRNLREIKKIESKLYKRPVQDTFELWISSIFDFILELVKKGEHD